MTAEELAGYARTNGYAHVYAYQLPSGPGVAVAFVPYPGRPGEYEFGTAAVQWEHPRLQVQVRGEPGLTKEPHDRAYALAQLLGAISVQIVGGVLYRSLQVLQPPFWLMQDANKCHVFAFNVEPNKGIS